jgi:MoxR-like ATPase
MRFSLGYPNTDDELKMLALLEQTHPVEQLQPVVSAEELIAAQQAVRQVHVDDKIRRYLVQIVQATRDSDELSLGGSPRASIALFRTSQALAAVGGRNYVQPDDVKKVAGAVMAHRLILRPEARLRKVTALSVLEEIVEEVPVPMLSEAPNWP